MHSRKRDHIDHVRSLDSRYKAQRFDSSDQLDMLSPTGVVQPMMHPSSTYGASSLGLTQSSGFGSHHYGMSMQHPLLSDYSQAPSMSSLLANGHPTASHGLPHALGQGLSLETDHGSYFGGSILDDNTYQGQRTPEGFPSPSAFEDLLNDYIESLSPKKRDKALIPKKRYDNILLVLREPKCTTIESAQFRFWAKKMFALGSSHHTSPGDTVVHEGKPVAVREDLYRVLIEAHGLCQHGGRDKTSAQVRKYYSWVPKELIARFVRNCPTCSVRRNPVGLEMVSPSSIGPNRNGQTTPPASAHSNSPIAYSNHPTPVQPLSPVDSRRTSIAAQSMTGSLASLGSTATAMDTLSQLSASEPHMEAAARAAFTYASNPGMIGTVANGLSGYPSNGFYDPTAMYNAGAQ